MGKSTHQSRYSTPWDKTGGSTPLQSFLVEHYHARYDARHPPLASTGEAAVINSYLPEECPFCGSTFFVRNGKDSNGIQRYVCRNPDCKRRFTPISGTIFDGHKISLSEWMEYTLNIIRHLSINADSWNNRNAFSTSRYWLEKVFNIASEVAKNRTLSGTIWFDETFRSLPRSEVELKPDGTRPRGVSRNQLCIGVACTRDDVHAVYEGLGPPTSEGTLTAFQDHIKPGSTLIHDMSPAHNLLIQELGLTSFAYNSKAVRKMTGSTNPLDRVNTIHTRLGQFLDAHSSFKTSKLQGFLDLFSLAHGKPENPLEKVELLLDTALSTRKVIRYRDFYSK